MDFSQRLKELREEKGYTRTFVANACNVSIQCISSLEAGSRSPTGSTLVVLADFFDCSIDYLMGRQAEVENISVPMNAGEQLSPTEKKLLDEYRKLDYGNKMYAETYITMRLEDQENARKGKKA